MNPTHVAAFRAVAEAGGFTRGAAELEVSQSAVSKHVADLERALGVRLFDRIGRRVILTEAGELLLGYARRLAELSAEAETALADLSAMRRGRVRVGATPTLGTYLLPRTLVYFRQRFPHVTVSVTVQSAAALVARLGDGRIDVALVGSRPSDADAAVTELLTDPWPLVCAADHPSAGVGKVDLKRLAHERLILRDGRAGAAGWAERMLRARGCVPADALRLPHTESVKQAALVGLGVAFLPRMAVADDIAAGRLVPLTVPTFTLKRNCFWVEPVGTRRPKAVQAYWCVLKHAVRGTLPGRPR